MPFNNKALARLVQEEHPQYANDADDQVSCVLVYGSTYRALSCIVHLFKRVLLYSCSETVCSISMYSSTVVLIVGLDTIVHLLLYCCAVICTDDSTEQKQRSGSCSSLFIILHKALLSCVYFFPLGYTTRALLS